jgi:acyl-coenzyme A synthetase/AMP-(fatty) acid ligase
MMNLAHVLQQQYDSDKVLFHHHGNTITTTIFLQQVSSLMKKLMLIPERRFALSINDPYYFTQALVALLALGKKPILLPNNKEGTVNEFASEYDHILYDSNCLSAEIPLNSKKETEITFDDEQEIIFFTSGSSGQPKKVARKLKSLYSEVTMLESTFLEAANRHKVYSSVSHQHAYGLIFNILWPLFSGKTIVCSAIGHPEQVAQIADEDAILVTSPSLLSRLQLNTHCRLTVFTSGNLLQKQDAEHLNTHGSVKPYEVLGSTETGGVAYRQQLSSQLWQTLPEVSISCDDDSDCLIVTSPYFDGVAPYTMGDKVVLHSPQTFELLGRADRIVKVEGKRLSLSAMENNIKQLAWVKDAYAVLLEKPRHAVGLVLVLTAIGKEQLAALGKPQLNSQVRNSLAKYYEAILRPKKIRYIEKLPINTQGKIIRQEVLSLFEEAE